MVKISNCVPKICPCCFGVEVLGIPLQTAFCVLFIKMVLMVNQAELSLILNL
jgi:hypothetical protein